jgi:DNA modification methylase
MGSMVFFHTKLGRIVLGDSLDFMRTEIAEASVDLIMTSPPFGLVRKKTCGNVDAHDYIEWFRPFGVEFRRIMKPTGPR